MASNGTTFLTKFRENRSTDSKIESEGTHAHRRHNARISLLLVKHVAAEEGGRQESGRGRGKHCNIGPEIPQEIPTLLSGKSRLERR